MQAAGHDVPITHPEKVFFPEHGETKGDLAEHYLRVEEPIMRAMGGRPVLLQRFPEGATGSSFFQKRVPKDVPDWLHAVVVHPDQVLETRRSRAVLAEPYRLPDLVQQTAHLAQFLLGLQRGDAELIRDGLRDVLVEPRRAPLIPGFAAVKAAALDHGALGSSISGGGPSVFAWFASREQAERAAPAMREGFVDAGFDARAYVTPVDAQRADVLAAEPHARDVKRVGGR